MGNTCGAQNDIAHVSRRSTLAKRLFVENLSFKITQEELESLFAKESTVTSTAIIMDRFSGRSRGFGFTDTET